MTAQTLLTRAKKEEGYEASYCKRCKYNKWFYGYDVSGDCYDWCAVFVCWVFAACNATKLIYQNTASCGDLAYNFYRRGRWVWDNFKPGDIVFMNWDGGSSSVIPGSKSLDHVGIIVCKNSDGSYTTIEGNTGGGDGSVLIQKRWPENICGAGRPAYEAEPAPKPKPKTADIYYRVRTAESGWLPEVKNCEDYAGIRGQKITDIAITSGLEKVKYKVHDIGGKWLAEVNGYNINDDEKGYAGDGKPIDMVKIATLKDYYVYYRVSPIGGDYYAWQVNTTRQHGMDGYAGAKNKAIDRIQIKLVKKK